MKLLPAECRTTAQPSQSIQVQPGFIEIIPWESPWLCYSHILNTAHRSQEQKSASASSPDLLAQGQRGCACLLHTLAEPELAARRGGAGCTQSLCSRGESRTETQEQQKLSQCCSQDSSSSNHVTPAFALWTMNSHFSFKSCFSLHQAEEWFVASNLIFH